MAIKQYKTIKEVVGPLMLVEKVRDVKYDELVEIKLPMAKPGWAKSWKSMMIKLSCQLFESSQCMKIDDAKANFFRTRHRTWTRTRHFSDAYLRTGNDQ
jgi:V/A-type H+-transporting ATPase subunit B